MAKDGIVHPDELAYQDRLKVVNKNSHLVAYHLQTVRNPDTNVFSVIVAQKNNCTSNQTGHLEVTIDDTVVGSIQVRHSAP